jgi:hypothetical protein
MDIDFSSFFAIICYMKMTAGIARAFITFGTLSPQVAEAAPMPEVITEKICLDANGGQIDPSDPVNVTGIQEAVGAVVDGKFGRQTCSLVWQELIEDGHLSGNGSALKIGPIVHNWLNVPLPQTTGSALESTPSPVTPPPVATDKECHYGVISNNETALLLSQPGLPAQALCELVIGFQEQNALFPDGIVGPKTATKLIVTSENPCNLYGAGIDDCFMGVQKSGNLGTLYTVRDGDIIDTMPARFGNPNRTKGSLTPEGTFTINRYREGDWASVNCLVVNGLRQACMRNPLYFAGRNNGIAIHGTKLPQDPNGSLGCVGVSESNSDKTLAYYKSGIKKVVIVDFQRN